MTPGERTLASSLAERRICGLLSCLKNIQKVASSFHDLCQGALSVRPLPADDLSSCEGLLTHSSVGNHSKLIGSVCLDLGIVTAFCMASSEE